MEEQIDCSCSNSNNDEAENDNENATTAAVQKDSDNPEGKKRTNQVPLVRNKSSDPYEWAYEVWYQNQLLAWRPRSFHDAEHGASSFAVDAEDDFRETYEPATDLFFKDYLADEMDQTGELDHAVEEEFADHGEAGGYVDDEGEEVGGDERDDGGVSVIDIPMNKRSSSQGDVKLRNKSSDPMQWAYEVWFQKRLLNWRPEKYHEDENGKSSSPDGDDAEEELLDEEEEEEEEKTDGLTSAAATTGIFLKDYLLALNNHQSDQVSKLNQIISLAVANRLESKLGVAVAVEDLVKSVDLVALVQATARFHEANHGVDKVTNKKFARQIARQVIDEWDHLGSKQLGW